LKFPPANERARDYTGAKAPVQAVNSTYLANLRL
jgi:hypothetical protein